MSGTGGIVLTISHDKCTVYYAKTKITHTLILASQ